LTGVSKREIRGDDLSEGTSVVAIKLSYPSPRALNEKLYANGHLGGVTVEAEAPDELGARVELSIEVERPPRSFVVLGQIAWARRKASKALGFSYGVDFVAEQGDLAQRLVAFARNQMGESAMRYQRRFVFDLKATVTYGGISRVEHVADLSVGGAFVRTTEVIATDQLINIKLRLPGHLFATSVKARVAWSRTGADSGIGIEFIDDDGTLHQRLERLLSKQEQK
jgi:Tfp pilus assembly protein PilZ